jgi:transposase
VNKTLPEYAKDKTIEIWFQDEARVGQKGSLSRLWAKRGSRPAQPCDQRYQSGYIFGAVCPARDLGAAIIVPKANADAMNTHLAEISHHIAENAHAILIMDQAGWHGVNCMKPPKNITPLRLPPYAPQLNPVENIWQYLRQNYLGSRIFETVDDIVDACCEAWNNLINEKGRIKSIASREWIKCVS